MTKSSLLGGTHAQVQSRGKDTDALGPSDNSDSGSDAQGAYGDGEMHSDSDAVGTGERASVGNGMERADADILPDHIEEGRGFMLVDDVDDIDSSDRLDVADIDELASDDDDEDEESDETTADYPR
ncbi:MAG: hypothetical protein V4772_28045 [Pseudomonadota bacterium]